MTGSEIIAVIVFGLVGVAAYQAGVARGWHRKEREDLSAYECGVRDGWTDCCDLHGIPDRPPLRVIPGGKGDAA